MIHLARDYAWLLIDTVVVAVLTFGVVAALWLVLTNLRDCWRALRWAGDAIRRGRLSSESAAPEPLAPLILEDAPASPARITLDAQWARVTDIVASGVGRTQAMQRAHGDAGVQLDAALYGLERLGAELTGLVPLRNAPAARNAEIHWLRDRFKGREKTDQAEAA